MKAKKVYEAINFQRGKDPKEALSLGQWRDGYVVEFPGEYEDLHMGISRYIEFNNYEWVKKEFDPEQIHQTEVTSEIEDEISQLPVLSFKGYRNSGNMIGLLDDWPEDFKYREIPFVANVLEEDDRTFLVDPEGFPYARYITELI